MYLYVALAVFVMLRSFSVRVRVAVCGGCCAWCVGIVGVVRFACVDASCLR